MLNDCESAWLQNLVVAIIAQAVRDSKHSDHDQAELAQAWLVETGSAWLDAMGYDGELICKRILDLPVGSFYFEWGRDTRGRRRVPRSVQKDVGRSRTSLSLGIGEDMLLD